MPQGPVILSCTFFGMTFKVLIGLFYLPNFSIIINYDFSEVRVNVTIGWDLNSVIQPSLHFNCFRRLTKEGRPPYFSVSKHIKDIAALRLFAVLTYWREKSQYPSMILSRVQSEVGSLRSCSTFLPHPSHVPVESTSKTESKCFFKYCECKQRTRKAFSRARDS